MLSKKLQMTGLLLPVWKLMHRPTKGGFACFGSSDLRRGAGRSGCQSRSVLFSLSEKEVWLCLATTPSLAEVSSTLRSQRSRRRNLKRRTTVGTIRPVPTILASTIAAAPLRATFRSRMSRSSFTTAGFPNRENGEAIRLTVTRREAAQSWVASLFSIPHRRDSVCLRWTSWSFAQTFRRRFLHTPKERLGTQCLVILSTVMAIYTCRHTTQRLDRRIIHRTPHFHRSRRAFGHLLGLAVEGVTFTTHSMIFAQTAAVIADSLMAVADRMTHVPASRRETNSFCKQVSFSCNQKLSRPWMGGFPLRKDAHLTCTPVQTAVNSPVR